MRLCVILLAGGTGQRFQSESSSPQNKLLLTLSDGKSAFEHSLSTLLRLASDATDYCIVTPLEWQADYREKAEASHSQDAVTILWTNAGKTRRESVLNGLSQLYSDPASLTSEDIVLIHDAARPLAAFENIQTLLRALQASGCRGASLGLPSPDTLKQVDSGHRVSKTLPRHEIWRVHTPQAFYAQALLQAHHTVPTDIEMTDDGQLIEAAGLGAILMVPDTSDNLKLTTSSDLAVINALIQTRLETSRF